ncbi:thioredoxin domain-containing protein [Candidatus Uhrbacteria bacterium]|nr:thioredoxin domain-containing protein [Candidatus Uhrbacteria bacterium]MBD3284255.1 thioredoxin domain-containing protein [Candidatus Uhrbacteria bacterium]
MSEQLHTPHNSQEGIAGLNGSPKTMFILGLATGIGSMAVIALIFMMTMFMQGTGVLAMNDGNERVAAAPTAPTAAADPAAAPTAPTPPAAPVPPVTDADHIKGAENAKVTLIEYSDFECPFCTRHVDTLEQLLADYPNDVRIVYRHFPLSFHPMAQPAAVASECAALQGKFWEMHDELFALAEGAGLSDDGIKNLAPTLGLNAEAFNSCYDNQDTASDVDEDYQSGIAAGVGGTPGTFVNGQLVEGAVPFETFKQIVESEGASS